MPDLHELARGAIESSIRTKQGLQQQLPAIVAAGQTLIDAYRAGNKALFFGNGGSAADAQHLAAELVGRYYLDRPPLPALALTVDTSGLTAIANDLGYDRVFARQLEALGRPGDVAVGISTSGNSASVVEAFRVARARGIVTVALTGEGGGALATLSDQCICVPSLDTPRIQECHILIGHVWCEMIERAMFA